MRRFLKYFLRTLLALFLVIILWIIGLFAGLPLFPWIETDYFVQGTSQTLGNELIIKQTDNEIIKLEVADGFPENNQCFDFRFSSTGKKHLLTVKDFSLKIFDNDNSEIKKDNSYLFWDNGSKDETFNIDTYEIEKTGTYDKDKYVFFRTVFDMDNIDNFTIVVKTTYSIDKIVDVIDRKIFIDKKHKLTWSEFRVH